MNSSNTTIAKVKGVANRPFHTCILFCDLTIISARSKSLGFRKAFWTLSMDRQPRCPPTVQILLFPSRTMCHSHSSLLASITEVHSIRPPTQLLMRVSNPKNMEVQVSIWRGEFGVLWRHFAFLTIIQISDATQMTHTSPNSIMILATMMIAASLAIASSSLSISSLSPVPF